MVFFLSFQWWIEQVLEEGDGDDLVLRGGVVGVSLEGEDDVSGVALGGDGR